MDIYLARAANIAHFPLRRAGAECNTPAELTGNTRVHMNENYAFSFDEVTPVVLQAIRYQWWFDHPSTAFSENED